MKREIRILGDAAIVPLTRGLEAVVDLADLALVRDHLWLAVRRGNKFYAGRSDWTGGKCRLLLMHRVILSAPREIGVDHRNGDGLCNRRHNLRLATKSQNAFNAGAHCDNASGFKGVCWHKQRRRWKAEISAYGVRKHLGLFDTPEEASAAYKQAARTMHGEFARLQ